MIQQRVNAALGRAGAQDKRLGRPKIDAETEWAICQAALRSSQEKIAGRLIRRTLLLCRYV